MEKINEVETERLILARVGEVALKGLNRGSFINKIISNLASRVKRVANYKVYEAESRIWIEPRDEEAAKTTNLEAALDVATKVFGIVSASLVYRFTGGFEEIKKVSDFVVKDSLAKHNYKTFKVETKRADKSFPMISPEVSSELGGFILENNPSLSVDVHEPELTVYVEIREHNYVYTNKHKGVRGLPVGTSGKGLLLLSGGIDSPVAGFQMASRGMEIEAIYFHTYPFTSEAAKDKVKKLAKILSQYTGQIKLHIVDFTSVQLKLNKYVPKDMMTIVMRRFMMRIADNLAQKNHAQAIITGESLGQVASQTAQALMCTDSVVDLPVYRPLIGIDKDFTTDLAKFIGTYETSILPYQDCCTVFVAKHPKTKPSLEDAVEAEKDLDVEELVEEALNKIETVNITYKDED